MTARLARPSLDWLLVFVPVTIALRFLRPESATLLFACACLGIIPLAGWLGTATERVADRTSEGLGALLNATFGNAAELIIALIAMSKGLHDIVKASLTGSIIGNLLLVLGAAVVAGGLKHPEQRFNEVAARSQSTMLFLAAIGLTVPAAFHYLGGTVGGASENDLSLQISIVLLIMYGLGLLFSLRTHKQLFAGCVQVANPGSATWSVGQALGVLAASTALVAWMSEILVGTVERAAGSLGMTRVFAGVIVVAIVGNAAEHSTAIMTALKDRMDLSLGVSIGSSIQVALFVAPVLVLCSRFVGPRPMDLVFSPAEVMAVGLAVLITSQIAGDGESNWLEGAQLLAVYVILAIIFYFLPEVAHP